MSEIILRAEKIGFGYPAGKWRLEDAQINLSAGDIVGIVGPNGAGKSTFIKIAAGIIKPQAGEVYLNGQNMQHLSRRKIALSLGYLPQNVNSVFNYTTVEAVLMGRFAHLGGMGFIGDDDIQTAKQFMELTETSQYSDRVLSQLSGGERQRVLLASVLCQQPKVLLLDEPTTGLDLHHQVSFFALLKKLAAEGMAVAAVTHDLNLAAMFCNKIVLIKEGKIIKSGSVSEVLDKEVLKQVYPRNVFVGIHPAANVPVVLPVIEKM